MRLDIKPVFLSLLYAQVPERSDGIQRGLQLDRPAPALEASEQVPASL